MNAKQQEYERMMASQRRRAREAAEAAAATRRREAQQARWAREAVQDKRDREQRARDRATQEARKPKAKCCGKPLHVRNNGIDYCKQCWEKFSK